MKTMRIEKQLILEHEISEIIRVSIQEGLQYKKEEEGVRAIGPLYVLGSYLDEQGQTRSIKEMIDMDVFAPSQKLSQEDFYIQIGEVAFQGNKQELSLEIELQIAGLKDEVEESSEDTDVSEAPTEDKEEDRALALLDDCFDDLFEEESTYTTCRLVVAKKEDSYASIAQRYQVDPNELRNCNQNREILEKTLIRLP